MDLYQDEFKTPIGIVTVVSDGVAVRAVDFDGYEERLHRLLARHYGRYALHSARDPGGAVARLRAYFAGDLAAIAEIPTATNGTPFQHAVWSALRTIPVGATATYGEIAVRIGKPNACRAVGLANGANPIAVIVPCHRVIGSNARLTGYGGGLHRKQWLLSHEGRRAALKS
ncbi:MAG: methylated-DNA--[protein]-cysteine S-methyltransferase [Planctomycetia bacterium]